MTITPVGSAPELEGSLAFRASDRISQSEPDLNPYVRVSPYPGIVGPIDWSEWSGDQKVSAPQKKFKIKRRLQGFFIQEEGEEARVVFVEDGALIPYYMPLKMFSDAGVKAENQPFELDELELKLEGIVFTGHSIRALAPAASARQEGIELDPERRSKLERILKRGRDAKG